jgi:hypothetical protein
VGGSAQGRPRRRYSCGPRSESPLTRMSAARFDYEANLLQLGSVQSLPEKSVSFAPLGHSLSGGFFTARAFIVCISLSDNSPRNATGPDFSNPAFFQVCCSYRPFRCSSVDSSGAYQPNCTNSQQDKSAIFRRKSRQLFCLSMTPGIALHPFRIVAISAASVLSVALTPISPGCWHSGKDPCSPNRRLAIESTFRRGRR